MSNAHVSVHIYMQIFEKFCKLQLCSIFGCITGYCKRENIFVRFFYETYVKNFKLKNIFHEAHKIILHTVTSKAETSTYCILTKPIQN